MSFFDGRWAAKEAIVKACTWRSLTFNEIQVRKATDGESVYGVILDKASVSRQKEPTAGHAAPLGVHVRDAVVDDETGQVVKISISHDGEYATAVCMAAVEPSAGDVGGEAAAREEL